MMKGDTVYAGAGKLSPNPLEYAPRGTLKELSALRSLVREIVRIIITLPADTTEVWEAANAIIDRPEVKAIMEGK
ncbi:MAG: hypothetical protein WC749_02005 [Dehalococcoidia bacterium]